MNFNFKRTSAAVALGVTPLSLAAAVLLAGGQGTMAQPDKPAAAAPRPAVVAGVIVDEGAPVREEEPPAVSDTTESVSDTPVSFAVAAPPLVAEDEGLIPPAYLERENYPVRLCVDGYIITTGIIEVETNGLQQYVLADGQSCSKPVIETVRVCLPDGTVLTTGPVEVQTNNLGQYVCPEEA